MRLGREPRRALPMTLGWGTGGATEAASTDAWSTSANLVEYVLPPAPLRAGGVVLGHDRGDRGSFDGAVYDRDGADVETTTTLARPSPHPCSGFRSRRTKATEVPSEEEGDCVSAHETQPLS